MTDHYQALIDSAKSRHSCRQFAAKPVPDEIVSKILTYAALTPSWSNTQPWRVDLVVGDAVTPLASALHDTASTTIPNPDFAFPEKFPGEYRDRRRASGLALYGALGIGKDDKAGAAAQMLRNFSFFGAPQAAIISTPADLGVYGAIDSGLYIQAFLTAAHSLGVSAVPQASLASVADELRRHLDIPQDRRIVAGISFGWEDTTSPANQFRTERAPVEDSVVRHGRVAPASTDQENQ
ncbi:nitroreductase [Gordonia sp. CPCC 205333]|uniref:nitroreductase n=1 Tax=Gordonia sp. CPCC 205333 TaxID=3140790 RepID=UPI003AF363F1